MKTLSIFWFRRDLRLDDNKGLYFALKENKKVLPIFIFDQEILDNLPSDDSRVYFIFTQLKEMNNRLDENQKIQTYHGKPIEIFKTLINKYDIKSVYTNHDYEPYGIKRDKDVYELLKINNIILKTYKDQVIFEKNEVTKDDGNPYKVFTPYCKKWMKIFNESCLNTYPSQSLLKNLLSDKNNWVELNDIGFIIPDLKICPYNLNSSLISSYELNRNIPSIDGTSRLGPHLRFGTISIRKVIKEAKNHNNPTFLKELIWREFFMQILWHFPQTVTKSFKEKYDGIKWRNDNNEFKKWCEGETGYPLVDAGMRELNQTGFMHNRVRMLVGSFLCKHLLIDWRWGEAYFALKLHDYELSSNVSNWQWVAGCGVDAAPYFRIFNPTTQIIKFDKDHIYIKKWVPEYQEFNYAKPMVDHKYARERCLKTYKEALR